MKRLVVLGVLILFLFSFVAADYVTITDITSAATDNQCESQGGVCVGSGADCSESYEEDSSFLCNANGEKCCIAEDDENETELEIEKEDENGFCGTSTLGTCTVHSDCIRAGCSNSVCQSQNEEPSVTTCEFRECYDTNEFDAKCGCINGKCQWVELGEISRERIKEAIKEKNKINVTSKAWGSCPLECTCTGSTVKCILASGREMTVYAGKSGNVIVQVKGENMTTNVTLYKSGEKLYGVFRNNETKIVRMLPDQVRERIRERIKARLQNENITLNEDGEYEYQAEKDARLFFVFKVKEKVNAKISAETGEVVQVNKVWWGFLAKDEAGETLLGESCGTVTPGQNDACCANKGYDVWNSEKQQCEFVE